MFPARAFRSTSVIDPYDGRGESSEHLQASPWHRETPELAHQHLIRGGLHDIDYRINF